MRNLYIIAPNSVVDAAVIAAAGTAEIVCGVPPRLAGAFPNPSFPFTYTEPDDPDLPSLRQAVQVLRNQFGTSRTVAQVNNALDAITVVLRRIARTELDR